MSIHGSIIKNINNTTIFDKNNLQLFFLFYKYIYLQIFYVIYFIFKT